MWHHNGIYLWYVTIYLNNLTARWHHYVQPAISCSVFAVVVFLVVMCPDVCCNHLWLPITSKSALCQWSRFIKMIQQLNQHTCRIFLRLYTDNPAFLPTGDARVDTESRQVCQWGSETFIWSSFLGWWLLPLRSCWAVCRIQELLDPVDCYTSHHGASLTLAHSALC